MRLPVRHGVVLAVVALVLTVSAAATAGGPRAQQVNVALRDFHITAPAMIRAGRVTMSVSNIGPNMHAFAVVRADGKPLPMNPDGLTVDLDAIKSRIQGGLPPAEPGRPRTVQLNLKPGRYVLLCNMSGHYIGGMDEDVVVR